MAAGRERRSEADTFAARLKKLWHRARTGLRRSAVDYFRGDGSDWIALAGLLITIPVIAATTLVNSVWCSPAVLVLPIVAAWPAAPPREPARAVRGGRHRADSRVREARPLHGGPLPGHPRRGPGRRGLRFLRPADRPVPQPGGRSLATRRHHALRPARTHPGAEQAAAAPGGLAPRDGAAPGGRPVVLRRLRRGRPDERRPDPRSRPHGRLRKGDGRRPPAPCCCPEPSAACSARSRRTPS